LCEPLFFAPPANVPAEYVQTMTSVSHVALVQLAADYKSIDYKSIRKIKRKVGADWRGGGVFILLRGVLVFRGEISRARTIKGRIPPKSGLTFLS
jgi:hypothetical protein